MHKQRGVSRLTLHEHHHCYYYYYYYYPYFTSTTAMSHASGLAASIRGSTESDTFDLAGQSVSTITTNIRSALEDPFPISHMIRITLIVGAGKVGRQKYEEHAAKAVTSTLKEMGFDEDRGASCIPACAGTFKLQHDTGKNLKTVVVFPNIGGGGGGGEELVVPDGTTLPTANGSGGGGGGHGPTMSMNGGAGRVKAVVGGLLTKTSPRETMALSSKDAFESIVKSQCPTWSQKKECLAELAELVTILQDLETKLIQGISSLSDAEQTFYENVSATVLDEKQTLLKDQMHQMVEEGKITSLEKSQLLAQVNERLDAMAKELEEAETNGQSKKVEKIKMMKEKAQVRKEKLSTISPKPDPPLKHYAEIFKLRSELKPLLELEDGARGRLLSIKETQTLARKDDILAKITDLEEMSRGWFEADDRFKARVDACSAAWAAQNMNKKKATTQRPTSSSATATSRSKNAWVTSSSIRPQGASMSTISGGVSKKKSSSKGGGGVFAAMMLDSDSD